MEPVEVLVVGAGLAGLSFAERLHRAGRRVMLLDRGRRPGGRCATRRFGTEVFDHGPVFAHGRDPQFLELVRRAGAAGGLRSWPTLMEGSGTPCNVEAVGLGVERLALGAGLNDLPAYLARELDVRVDVKVERLAQDGIGLRVQAEGLDLSARHLVLALPPPQVIPLLRTLEPEAAGVAPLIALAELVPYVASLAVALRYPIEQPPPAFDLCLPREPASPVQLISHESAKRASPSARVFVIQARPAWSREHLDADPSAWSEALRRAAAFHHPPLEAPPEAQYTHRWRFARMAGPGLSAPVWAELGGGALLGLTGEAFDPAGGLEGAWRSGVRLAERYLERGVE